MQKGPRELLALQLLLFGVCRGLDWMDQPYESRSDFNVLAEYTHNATLECKDERDDFPESYQFEYWIRPDLTVMAEGDDEYFKTLDGPAGWYVDNDKNMRIVNVQEQHFGFYHCVVYSVPDIYVIKKGLNYRGPYFGDLWDVYRLNTIIGVSAGAGFLAACILIYILHCSFCNKEDDIDKPGENGDLSVILANGEDSYQTLDKIPGSDLGYEELATNSGATNKTYMVDAADEDITQL